MLVPDRRTLIVLGSLVMAMTLAGAVLLLEPRPAVPGSEILLSRFDRRSESPASLFQTASPADARRWDAIVIHYSGSLEGSALSVSEMHQRLGLGGLGYHFVLNNGTGGPDGQIVMGYRWRRQLDGAYTTGTNADWFNRHAIGVCLVGDPQRLPPTEAQVQELVWLVRQLQAQYDIPAERVLIHGEGGAAGRFFPAAAFRQHLAADRTR